MSGKGYIKKRSGRMPFTMGGDPKRYRARVAAFRQGARGNMVPRRSVALDRQIKALIAAKKRDGSDITRDTASQTTTTISCLTSSTNFATAATGTGLIDADADEALINSVRMSGRFTNGAVLDADPSTNVDTCVRKIVVWFNKPLLVASAAGTLPPITEVLVSDEIDSLPISAAQNGGRFVILSDKKWNLGSNTYQSATAAGHARCSGRNHQYYDYFVKVNKKCKFVYSSQSGSASGGHYDSDSGVGQVSTGLLICYTVVQLISPATVGATSVTRLNYTA